MSFCRITGRSRGLPKPNYFPLLPPISPADAKRFCRITGKSYGLATHHYIPVVLGFHSQEGRNKKCKITTKSQGLSAHHYTAGIVLAEKKKHVVIKDYRYVFPKLDGEGEQQVALRSLLESKEFAQEEESCKFVYTVAERRCSLVFPARLEAAVRDGDVRDVMLSKDCDTVLLRLKQGKNVSVDFCDLEEYDELYDGFGPREDVLKERQKSEAEAKKRKKRKQGSLSYAKKIFEDKEKAAEEEELKIAKQVKLRSVREEKTKEKVLDWKQVGAKEEKSRQSIVSSSCEWKEIQKPLDHTIDWSALENNSQSNNVKCTPVIQELPVPVPVEAQTVDLEKTPLGAYNKPVSEDTAGFETIAVVEPFAPLTAQPNPDVQKAIKELPTQALEDTSDVYEKLVTGGQEALQTLPRIEDIPKIVEGIKNGESSEVQKVKGLKLDIKTAQRFIVGQTVQTPLGDVFVPGQTLQTENGRTFVPGFTVHTPDGPMLIPGQIVEIREEKGMLTPVFVAGQTLPTTKGEDFVQGQTIHTNEGPKFVPGQTVLTKDGPKFVAGQVVDDNTFVPGQVVNTPDGARFMPGQTIIDELGQQIFIPGQSYEKNGNWEFMPGQYLSMENGSEKFVPGQTMLTSSGLQFVPGQSVTTESGESQFVPGMTLESDKGQTFVPGMTLNTPQGVKFVEGQVVRTEDGEKFVPGVTNKTESGFDFAVAKSMNDITFSEPVPSGIPVDPKTAKSFTASTSEIFGHIIQTETGVEFIPESAKKTFPGKKMIPGQLVRDNDSHRFVPGIMTEDGFLPGQLVNTEAGEQFIPGQVVDTASGPKFVPGQMVETRSGLKFVPGQTVNTEDGPQFVPGQIVETKVGPTFIPGQVISTEDEGSRFVPGQVVDTPDGPRFVPGRVVESAEHGVIFVPGQIVQTEEGPRFVAPDLIDTPEGELEFSVQGFEVTPEELKLLRPQHLKYNTSARGYSESSIDAKMLRQLSDAGVSLGKNVSVEIPNVDIDVDPKAVNFDHAVELAEKLGLEANAAVKMAQILSTLATLAEKVVYEAPQSVTTKEYQNGHSCATNGKLENGSAINHKDIKSVDECWAEETLKSMLTKAVAVFMNEKLAHCASHGVSNGMSNGVASDENASEDSRRDIIMSAINEALQVLQSSGDVSLENSVDKFLGVLLIPQKRSCILKSAISEVLNLNGNKIDILKSTLIAPQLENETVIDRLTQVLEEENEDDVIGPAFRTVSRNDPELISRVLQQVSREVASVETDRDASETVQKAIVQAVQEYSEARLQEILGEDSSVVRELLIQAVGLASALGMSSTASFLLSVISDEKSTEALASDKLTLDILKRLTIMRKLAEQRPQLAGALKELASNSDRARSNPSLRTLVRESAALMIVREDVPLESSSDIPAALLRAENTLAMEDFMMRRASRRGSTFLILKQGLQAVVPREAARSVLRGEVAYTLLDENGIQHFEPLHVFSALRLSKPATHRFSMYCCPVAEVESDFQSTYGGARPSITPTSSIDYSCTRDDVTGVDLAKSDGCRSVSRENTPCFMRMSSLVQDNNNGKSENYVVVKDFTGEGDSAGFSVNVGDIVEAIEYAADNSK